MAKGFENALTLWVSKAATLTSVLETMWYRTSSSNFHEPWQSVKKAVSAENEPHKTSLASWEDMRIRTASLAGALETSGAVTVLSSWHVTCHFVLSPLHHLLFQHRPYSQLPWVLQEAGIIQGQDAISTSWDTTSSVSQPAGPLWHLFPTTVPTKPDTFQGEILGLCHVTGRAMLSEQKQGRGGLVWESSSLYMTGDLKSCSYLGVSLIFNY